MTNEELKLLSNLRATGIENGCVLLVHSSMKAIGTALPPEKIIDILQTAVGPDGTLMLPALSYAAVTPEHPVFDSATTEPCIGLLPRVFWKLPGVVRSQHPTHSVCARGRRAAELTGTHYLDETPVGANSPFRKMLPYGGRILFIGDILRRCTFMHGVEESVGTDYVLNDFRTHYIVDGRPRDMFGHNFAGWGQRYERIAEILAPGEIVSGKFGAAQCTLVDANALMEKASAKLREDMHWFVFPGEED